MTIQFSGVSINGTSISYIIDAAASQVSFTTPGEYSWVVPAGVTKISMVAVGAGGAGTDGNISTNEPGYGGGGGALAYTNNYTVVPGSTLTINVGAGGTTSGENGGNSTVKISSTVICGAGGGSGGVTRSGGVAIGTNNTATGVGGNGGTSKAFDVLGGHGSGGGGAGGYGGPGGSAYSISGGDGSNGGGGGGGGVSYNQLDSSVGLVAYYLDFNLGKWKDFTLSSPEHVTLSANTAITTMPTTNYPAVRFYGTSDSYSNTPNSSKFELTSTLASSFTIEAWVYTLSYGGEIVNKDSEYEVAIFGPSGQVAVAIDWGTGTDANTPGGGWMVTTAIVPLSTATHVAVVIDGYDAHVYINGSRQWSASVEGYPNTLGGTYYVLDRAVRTDKQDFYIGNRTGKGQPFDGYISAVRVWNVARTQTQISNNYQNFVPADWVDPITTNSGGGGGVDIYGQGTSGTGAHSGVSYGSGGSGGTSGSNGSSTAGNPSGGNYGGGGAGGLGEWGTDPTGDGGHGGNGAVRIIWPGSTRIFPGTGTADV